MFLKRKLAWDSEVMNNMMLLKNSDTTGINNVEKHTSKWTFAPLERVLNKERDHILNNDNKIDVCKGAH